MKRSFDQYQRSQQGLTLFELLVVLAIIALLATLVAPRVFGYLGRAKSDTARAQISSIATGLDLYALDMGTYPTQDQGLSALTVAPPGAVGWAGPYLREDHGFDDPWGRPYGYQLLEGGNQFEVSSLGRDGAEGGDGEDADIRKR